uniref:pleckstrin homology domain-containing family H member 3 n=1 Tax=Euleptes europaea TaxID=460621 RepID=UPI00254161F7|nr:pleckstrin homology domain-containing family H member 3 [Euleptes europaea]
MPFPGGWWWLVCCRQGGFTLLRRDYGEAGRGAADGEEPDAEALELRGGGGGQAPALQVNRTQPSRASSTSERSLTMADETCSLIPEKKCRQVQDDADPIMKGWLQREVRGGRKAPWWRPRKYWFVLSQESLDCYSGCEAGAPRLGSLVLTSLCSVLWPDKQTYKETGFWAVTVFGRKHCYRLYMEHLHEAVRWVCALQKVITSQAPVQTPTQLFMSDLEENHSSPEILDQMYHNNPILRYTAGPIYAPLLPFPYGVGENADGSSHGYAALRDEAVKLFHSLQQMEGVREPAFLMQGVLQTCLDLPPLVDEIYCQLVKQTTEPPAPGGPADLRYWQLLACMSCTFLPSPPVQCYLQLHLQRTENRFPGSEMARYGHFIREALRKTEGRERVPSLDEIAGLMRRREVACTAPPPGHVAITSHAPAQAVARELTSHLGLVCSPNSFALCEECGWHGCPLPQNALVADVLLSSVGEEPWKCPGGLCFKHYGCLDVDSIPHDNQECVLLLEQGQDPPPWWLVLRSKAVFLCRLGEADSRDAFGHRSIVSWAAAAGVMLHLSLGDEELLLRTPQAKEIVQLLLQACTADQKM